MKLVGGPGVFICERCVDLAENVLAGGSQAETPLGILAAISAEKSRERCSVCGKRRAEVTELASTGDVAICSECPKLCDEIVTERLS